MARLVSTDTNAAPAVLERLWAEDAAHQVVICEKDRLAFATQPLTQVGEPVPYPDRPSKP
jgi:hypothetical protein